jgi:hypothetical protein
MRTRFSAIWRSAWCVLLSIRCCCAVPDHSRAAGHESARLARVRPAAERDKEGKFLACGVGVGS